MHRQTTGIAPSTDFDLCFKLRNILVNGRDPCELAKLQLLSYDAVRFARNHDTIHNHQFAAFCGYRSDDVLLTLAWILVLSMDGGTVLIYPDDSERQIRGSKPLEA